MRVRAGKGKGKGGRKGWDGGLICMLSFVDIGKINLHIVISVGCELVSKFLTLKKKNYSYVKLDSFGFSILA